jgi:1-deoxy-D-xylulose-5-phosphate reductoisomerase
MEQKNNHSRPAVLVLGSTGSVGTQALDVAGRLNFPVDGICAHRNVDLVEEQARAHAVRFCAMADEAAAGELKIRLADTPTKVLSGTSGILDMIHESRAEIAVNSMLGEAGLLPTLAVIESGKQLALANKESLVVAGEVVMAAARKKGISIRPVDSEHCAIAQCLRSGNKEEVKRLIITASGGPFFGRKREELGAITREQALAHPTWKMGVKITIDSATLMNKGFEVIEASHLFGIPGNNIDVIVHRESIIHSMVEFIDNSVIAQMSVPDMRHCVQYALELPERHDAVIPALDFSKIGKLSFAEPDEDTFIPLKLARKSLSLGGASSAVLHSANEVAVTRFLEGKIQFTDIFDTLEYVCAEMNHASNCNSLSEILGCVETSAQMAEEYLARK